MSELLKKYLLCKFTPGGYPDKTIGNVGEVEEYGQDAEHALHRALEKYGGRPRDWILVGEIKT